MSIQDQINKLQAYIYSNQNTIDGLKLEIQNVQGKISQLRNQIYQTEADYNDLKTKYIKLDSLQPKDLQEWIKTQTHKIRNVHGKYIYYVKYKKHTYNAESNIPLVKYLVNDIENAHDKLLSENQKIIAIKNKLLMLMDKDKSKITTLNNAIKEYQKLIQTYNQKIKELEGYILYAQNEISKLKRSIPKQVTHIEIYKEAKTQTPEQKPQQQTQVKEAGILGTTNISKSDLIKLGIVFLASKLLNNK